MSRFEIYTPDFSNRRELSHAISISASECYNGIGKISIVLPINDYNIKIIERGSLVLDKKDWQTYFIEAREIDTKDSTITANGYSANWILNQRININKAEIKNVKADLYSAIRNNLRGLPNVEVPASAENDKPADLMIEQGQLLDLMLPVLSSVGMGNKMVWDAEQKKHRFEIYEGKDLTRHSSPPVKDKNTLLLLHGDDLTDSSIYHVPLTNQGVTVSAEQSKFGGKSLYFNGNSGIFFSQSVAPLKDGDFTIDWWECAENMPQRSGARYSSAFVPNELMGGLLIAFDDTVFASSSTTRWDLIYGAKLISTTVGKWVHWAFVRHGNTLTSYCNGEKYSSVALSGSIAYDEKYQQCIGLYRDKWRGGYKGYIDEFRISNIARWTENFTPPTEPYITEQEGKQFNRQIFSYERGTAPNLQINGDASVFKTVFYAFGKTTNSKLIYEVSGDEKVGAERYEKYINEEYTQSDDETEAAFRKRMKSSAEKRRAENIIHESFSIEIDPAEFGKSYNLGDIVSCVSTEFGVKFNKRIEQKEYKLDVHGEKVSLVLGEPKLNVIEEMRLNG